MIVDHNGSSLFAISVITRVDQLSKRVSVIMQVSPVDAIKAIEKHLFAEVKMGLSKLGPACGNGRALDDKTSADDPVGSAHPHFRSIQFSQPCPQWSPMSFLVWIWDPHRR